MCVCRLDGCVGCGAGQPSPGCCGVGVVSLSCFESPVCMCLNACMGVVPMRAAPLQNSEKICHRQCVIVWMAMHLLESCPGTHKSPRASCNLPQALYLYQPCMGYCSCHMHFGFIMHISASTILDSDESLAVLFQAVPKKTFTETWSLHWQCAMLPNPAAAILRAPASLNVQEFAFCSSCPNPRCPPIQCCPAPLPQRNTSLFHALLLHSSILCSQPAAC